jgi:hypothetical protein
MVGSTSRVLVTRPVQAEKPPFLEVQTTLDNPLSFSFPPELHGYIYRGVTIDPDKPFRLIRHQVAWRERFHLYFQDEARPQVFSYLPDNFKLARDDTSPYYPWMKIQFRPAESNPSDVVVQFDYIALPTFDLDRLVAATEALQKQVPPNVLQTHKVEFEPLLVTGDIEYRLTLPGQGAQTRPNALVSLTEGIQDTLTLSLLEFRAIFDALFTSGSSLFQGSVNVKLGEELLPPIPLDARLDDMEGPLFDSQEEAEAGGTVAVTLTNAIESPVRINSLKASLRRLDDLNTPAEAPISATIQALATPLELAPGASTLFRVVPNVPTDGELDAELDTSDVTVLPDREAVYAAILDPTVLVQPVVDLTIQTVPALFQPVANAAAIVAIEVLFDSGEIAQFTANTCTAAQTLCEQSLAIPLSLRDFIVGGLSLGTYRYKVRVIRADGTLQEGEEWQTGNQDRLFISVASLPGNS